MNLDPDGTLPVERTSLAWGRTLLGLAGVLGLAAADAIYADRVVAAAVFAVLAVVATTLSWSVAQRRAETITTAERRLDSAAATLGMTVLVVAVAMAAFVVILL